MGKGQRERRKKEAADREQEYAKAVREEKELNEFGGLQKELLQKCRDGLRTLGLQDEDPTRITASMVFFSAKLIVN
jgi:hypothetical protein